MIKKNQYIYIYIELFFFLSIVLLVEASSSLAMLCPKQSNLNTGNCIFCHISLTSDYCKMSDMLTSLK